MRILEVKGTTFLLIGCVLWGRVPTSAQDARAQSVISLPEAWSDVQHDTSASLSVLAASAVNLESQAVNSHWPSAPRGLATRAAVATKPGLNIDGIGSDPGWNTADTSGAVGATQYVQSVNVKVAVYDKTSGTLEVGPVLEKALFTGFGGPCQTTIEGDPSTQYDKAAGRWVISHHTPGPPFYECFAVSTTSDARGSYNRYAFLLPSNNYFTDYPKVGVWPDGYYVEFNLQDQNSGFTPVTAMSCAFDRNAMLAGAPATMLCFQVQANGHDLTILPSDLDGSTSPPTGAPNYFLELSTNALNLWKFHVDFQTPANSYFSGPTSISVAPFSEPCNAGTCVPQFGTTQTVDTVGDRLMNRVAYRNFGSYDVIMATHSIAAANPPRVAIRWYEIRNPGGTPMVYQQGTYKPDAASRWLGSIGMDKVGDIAVGYSVSSATMYPAIRYTGRVPTDPRGSMEGELSIIEGTGSQQPANFYWNDVSSLAIDPVDDCTFWYTNQYYKSNSTAGWSTRIASFKFTGCN